ncbi:MAG TPA: hypothetical protein PKC45_11115 [Gemmatales bacterium]|nr:hypothetical protein [Gemmatales bacterium]
MAAGADLNHNVQNGLAVYYAACAVANVGFAWYMQRTGQKRAAMLWWAVVGLFVLHTVMYLGHNLGDAFDQGRILPGWVRDTADYGLERGLISLGIVSGSSGVSFSTIVVGGLSVLMWLIVTMAALDAFFSCIVGGRFGKMFNEDIGELFGGTQLAARLVIWWLIISVLALILYGTGAVTYFVGANAFFAAALVWRKQITEPNVAWGILNFLLLFGGWSMTDQDFRHIVGKPDNIPIVFLVFTVLYFTWLALRRGVINDERMERGEAPLEKLEDEKVLVWPDLVYTELICMVVCTVLLVVWAVALPAPLEQPASTTKTPNPSKAPWYFLGLQEMLVYYDPWLAGVVFPTIIIIGLMAIPYIDFNQKGNGYYTFNQRAFSIINFLYGFIVLWVVLIFLGTFLRGPNWNFYGVYEFWDGHKLEPLNNVNLSDYFWLRGLDYLGYPKLWKHPEGEVSIWVILGRESPGIVLILAYFLLLPPLLARTVFRQMFLKMGFVRYIILINLLLFMVSLPVKMVLRWTINLKYIVAIPEWFFHI